MAMLIVDVMLHYKIMTFIKMGGMRITAKCHLTVSH